MSRSAHLHSKGPFMQGMSSSVADSLNSPSSFFSPSESSASTPTLAMASPATVYSDGAYPMPSRHQTAGKQQTMVVEFVRALPKGTVRFRPFEEGLDAAASSSIQEFRIYPFGSIEEYCRHIPYASGKKDFFDKTGRDAFEVFQYVFKMPGDDKEFHVMWDYNVGLVRITPFFKCCKYSKTTPAKMLNLNPGLRDITYSITGGSIMAQGYWMPYSCAKAVCATFCYHIAGALIPIFGPEFPSECVPPQSSDYGRMVIDPALVEDATRETEYMRQLSINSSDERAMLFPFHAARFSQRNQGSQRFSPRGDHDFRPSDIHLRVLPPIGPSHVSPGQVSVASLGMKPTLAPVDFASPHGGLPGTERLLPSPIDHERLPPLSYIASLPPLSPAFPPLPPPFNRGHNSREYRGRSLSIDNGFNPYRQWPLPSMRASVEERMLDCVNDKVPTGSNPTLQGLAKQSRKPTHAVSTTSIPSYYQPSHLGQWEERFSPSCSPLGGVSRPPGSSHAARRPDSEDGDGYDNRNSQCASSSCYPSPPRLPPLLPHATEATWKPSSLSVQGKVEGRGDDTKDKQSRAETEAAGSQERTGGDPKQRKLPGSRRKQQGGGSAAVSSSSSSTWNAKDVDAAELLVNFSVKVQTDSHGQGTTNHENAYSEPAEDFDTAQPIRKQIDRRFAVSVSSLLCDDTKPRKKRRGI